MMEQVISNLVDNACKYSGDTISINISTYTKENKGYITIADDGPGISKEHIQRIFERFTQLGDTLTGKPAGTGLGLSIAHRIVIAFGGQICCEESHLGGAQLRFVLPQVSLVAR